MIVYEQRNFYMTWDPESGSVYTHYADGSKSGCGLVPEDHIHAGLLGITSQEHRLQHELAHHIVGRRLPTSVNEGCSIIWNDAHDISQDQPEADVQEFLYTTIQYASRWKQYNRDHGLLYLEWMGISPNVLIGELCEYMSKAKDQV